VGIHTAIVIGLILYVVLTTAVSFYMMGRVRKPADYLVAGRGLPFWVLIGTIVGTCIGTGVVIGGSSLAYDHGWAGCAYPIGLGLGTALAGLCFAHTRRYKFMTLSEEIACYYSGNRGVVEFSNITLFVSQLCWLTVQIMGGAAVLGAVTGLQPRLCVLLAGFAKAAISIPGGLKAVVYTDVLQTVILFFGFGFLTHSALVETGGLDGLRHVMPPSYFSFLGVDSLGGWKIVSLIVALTLSVIADPGRRLTMYSARSEGAARWSMLSSGIIVIAFSVIIGITGMYAFHLNPTIKPSDQALPWLVMHAMTPWLAAFVVVAVTSGISSAANACAAAAGTFFVRHIYPLATGRFPARPVAAARWALAAAFALSTLLALFTKTIVSFVQQFLPITMSGLAVIVILGRFWKRATWQGALAALAVTPSVALTLLFALPPSAKNWNNAAIPALAGILAHLLVSSLSPPQQRGFAEVAESLTRQRQAIEGADEHEPTLTTAPETASARTQPAKP
jgi:solute:Na+ symporter, SSS family